MESINWGDAPTWIAAFFAGGAALFAGMTIRSQRQQIAEQRRFIGEQSRNLWLERAALEAGQQERRRAQAELVYVGRTNRQPVGVVENRSGAPITDVVLRAGDMQTIEAGLVYPGGDRTPNGDRTDPPFALIGAGRQATFRLGPIQPSTLPIREAFVATFTDADGIKWQRDENGLLAELPAEE
ncbi:hypothetical protein [Streptomyces sp. NPDC052179]|uniref:hypothetical protein n=1 Tax=Streptomyces sp. NPDC052179 TaxID=3155680 RepID=UPI00343DF839